jgi:hypothetical protein
MEEEHPPSQTYTPITPPEEESPTETEPLEQSENSNTSRRPPALLLIGFLLVIGLIIVGLFLPPISLGERLGFGGDSDEATAVAGDPSDESESVLSSTDEPRTDGALSPLSLAEFTSSEAWAAAAAAIPEHLTPVGTVYLVPDDSEQSILEIPAEAGNQDLIDLFGWDGERWVFVPSTVDASAQQISTVTDQTPQALIITKSAAPRNPVIGAYLRHADVD